MSGNLLFILGSLSIRGQVGHLGFQITKIRTLLQFRFLRRTFLASMVTSHAVVLEKFFKISWGKKKSHGHLEFQICPDPVEDICVMFADWTCSASKV
jgi:hypothetical protein